MNHNKKLFRDTANKMIGGVAAGLADYFAVDVTLVRILFIATIFLPLNFPVILLYGVLWLITPARKTEIPASVDPNP